jgi:hypothetical protein
MSTAVAPSASEPNVDLDGLGRRYLIRVNDGALLTPCRRCTFDPLARGRGHVGSSVGTLPRSRSLSR